MILDLEKSVEIFIDDRPKCKNTKEIKKTIYTRIRKANNENPLLFSMKMFVIGKYRDALHLKGFLRACRPNRPTNQPTQIQ